MTKHENHQQKYCFVEIIVCMFVESTNDLQKPTKKQHNENEYFPRISLPNHCKNQHKNNVCIVPWKFVMFTWEMDYFEYHKTQQKRNQNDMVDTNYTNTKITCTMT